MLGRDAYIGEGDKRHLVYFEFGGEIGFGLLVCFHELDDVYAMYDLYIIITCFFREGFWDGENYNYLSFFNRFPGMISMAVLETIEPIETRIKNINKRSIPIVTKESRKGFFCIRLSAC